MILLFFPKDKLHGRLSLFCIFSEDVVISAVSFAKKTQKKGNDPINDSILEVDCEKTAARHYQVNYRHFPKT